MKNSLEIAWVCLVFFSIFAFSLGYFGIINHFFVAILLLTTFIKGQLVIDYFMGLKSVKLGYRLIPSIWLFVVLLVIGMSYYLPIN